MWEAHVVLRLVVVPRFALALAVSVRCARGLHHLIVTADPTAQAPPDVVPHLSEGAVRTHCAVALPLGRALRSQVCPRGTAVTAHRRPGDGVSAFKGHGHAVDSNGEQHHREHR